MPIVQRACRFELEPAGFVRATIHEGADLLLEDARDALAATAEVAGGRLTPVLVDMRGIRWQSRDTRRYFASDAPVAVCSAIAILVGSPVSRVIGNFFLGTGAQKVPTELFTDEQRAIAWLLEPRG